MQGDKRILTVGPESFANRVLALAREFPEMKRIIDEYGVPEFWCRPPGFATLVLIVLEQQVSLRSAQNAYERIVSHVGRISAKRIIEAGESRLREAGITRQKSGYLVGLSDAVISGSLDLEALAAKTDQEVIFELTRLKGIGPWTAKVYLLVALNRRDVWPNGDLALVRAIETIFPDATDELRETGMRWAPDRAIAARLLWHWYLSQQE